MKQFLNDNPHEGPLFLFPAQEGYPSIHLPDEFKNKNMYVKIHSYIIPQWGGNDSTCWTGQAQLTILPARKTYVKRTQSSKGSCHLHLLCRRKTRLV